MATDDNNDAPTSNAPPGTEERELEQQALSDTTGSSYRDAPPADLSAQQLGVERWVQFSFIALAVVLIWVLDKFFSSGIELVGDRLDLPAVQPWLITAIAAVVGAAIGLYYYKREDTNRFAHEVVGELQNVTWPDREETWKQTVVVIITSIIASIVLFAFDQAWSNLTDLIYGT